MVSVPSLRTTRHTILGRLSTPTHTRPLSTGVESQKVIQPTTLIHSTNSYVQRWQYSWKRNDFSASPPPHRGYRQRSIETSSPRRTSWIFLEEKQCLEGQPATRALRGYTTIKLVDKLERFCFPRRLAAFSTPISGPTHLFPSTGASDSDYSTLESSGPNKAATSYSQTDGHGHFPSSKR